MDEFDNEDNNEDSINDNVDKEEKEPPFEPECSSTQQERDEVNIECEFENRDGSWWCITHNC